MGQGGILGTTTDFVMSRDSEVRYFGLRRHFGAPLPVPFSRYSSRPLLRASSCCSDREKGHFPGRRGKVKLANSRFRFWCRMANSR